ncbi:MAG: hypothetical protein IKU24_03560, partial [Clostridia bacterium]|nr:hypothetical protein [Clostridia bacterium]
MKKILCFSLALALIFSLALPVFAENTPPENTVPPTSSTAPENNPPENNVPETTTDAKNGKLIAKKIEVSELVLPVAREKVEKNLKENLKVKAMISVGSDAAATDTITPLVSDAYWVEADREDVKLTSSDIFVSGRTYRLIIVLDFSQSVAPEFNSDTIFSVNQTAAKYKAKQGEKIEFFCDFVATPGDISPKVSLSVEGEKKREYNGEEIVLTASVEQIEGVVYTYAWYRDDKEIEGATENILKLKNVSDSGEYYVIVSASISSEGVANEVKTTKSASQKISIKPHVITIEIQNAEKNIFDPDPEFTYNILGDVYDELSGSLERLEGEDVGKYSILIGSLGFSEEVSENYEIRVEQGTLSIIDLGELPFAVIKDIADQSYISGKNGAKIQISAPKGAIPEGAILSLTLLSSQAKEELEEGLSAKMLKGFLVELVDETGKNLSLPRRASLRIQIPLAQEEEKFDANTITAGLLTSSVSWIEAKVQETESVTYILVEIESLGSVALFEGDLNPTKVDVDKVEPDKVEKPKEKEGSLWMWILIGVVSLSAIVAI